MAVREIKTSITLDGEQAFRQAIAAANKELRVSEAELKAVASAYDLNGDKMQMLADKQRILGKEIAVQENTVSSLRARMKEAERVYEEAGKSVDRFRAELEKANASGNKSNIDQATKDVERAEAAYAEARKQLQNYQIETSNATAKLNQMRKTQQATDREIEEFGRDSIKVGRQIRDGIGDSAEAAEKDVRSLVQTVQDDLASIRATTTFTAIGSLWDMATDAYSSVSGFVGGTQEYRKQLSFLQQNAENYDIDFSFIKEQLIETQVLTGDASSAVEGLSNLLSTNMDTRQITEAVDLLAGAVIKFPDTLKFESLADGLQETIATGGATGAFAELLERLGVNVDDFNSALEKSETKAGDIEVALAYLSAHGLKDVYEQWKATNEEMVGSLETQAAIEQELAEFGGTLEKYIVTPVQEKLLEALKWVNEEVNAWEADPNAYVDELPGRAATYTKNILGDMWNARKKMVGIKDPLYDYPIGPPTEEKYRWQPAVDWIQSTFAAQEDSIPTDRWKTVLFNRATDAQLAAEDMISSFLDKWTSPEEAQAAGEEAATSFLDGWETMVIRPDLAQEAEGFLTDEEGNAVKPIGIREDWEEYLKTITDMVPEYQEAGEEAGEATVKGFGDKVSAAAEEAFRAGENAALNFGAGLASKVSYISAQAGALAAVANARMNAARNASTPFVLNLDGREVARGLAPYNSEAMAVQMGWS